MLFTKYILIRIQWAKTSRRRRDNQPRSRQVTLPATSSLQPATRASPTPDRSRPTTSTTLPPRRQPSTTTSLQGRRTKESAGARLSVCEIDLNSFDIIFCREKVSNGRRQCCSICTQLTIIFIGQILPTTMLRARMTLTSGKKNTK